MNCGWSGPYGNNATLEVCAKRYEMNKKAADDLGLPLYMVDSNLHAFLEFLDDQISPLYIYTCIFALEKALNKYYFSGSLSYGQTLKEAFSYRNLDFMAYGDISAVPLLHSKKMSVILDGCQYERVEKTELIYNWNITKKYLNVCCINDAQENCSECSKCLRTLCALDAIGCLDEYKDIFDIDKFKRNSYHMKCLIVKERYKNIFYEELYNLYLANNIAMPSKASARLYFLGISFRKRLDKLFNLFR